MTDRSATPRVGGLVVLVAVPLVVALWVLARVRWYPFLEMAQTEMHVRDVGTVHPRLIGLIGRIGTAEQPGAHPGPLSFWMLWPFYQLFGATSWALEAAGASLHLLAIGVTLWIAHRRGGFWLAVGFAAAIVVLMHGYGPSVLTQPWNPHVPLFWWIAFLVAVWSVLVGDRPMLPVAVFAGSLCAQTHISYLLLAAGLGLVAFAFAFRSVFSRGILRSERRSAAWWCLVAVGVGVVLWIPPVIDELTHSPGNMSVVWRYFDQPPEAAIGVRRAMETLLVHLNVWRLLTKQLGENAPSMTGSSVPGALFLAAWMASAILTWRIRHRLLLRLHLVIGLALILGLVSMSRIFGVLWYWLGLWAWGITALMLVALGWTVAAVAMRRADALVPRRAASAGKVAVAGVLGLFLVLMTLDASSVEVPNPRLEKTVGALVAPTAAAMAKTSTAGAQRRDRYLVSWSGQVVATGEGFALMNELERRGFDVGAAESYRVAVSSHRTLTPAAATAVVHLSMGPDIKVWRAKRDARQVAYADPRSPSERIEYEQLRSQVVSRLRAAGQTQLVQAVDENLDLFLTGVRLPATTKRRIDRMLTLGQPVAVFVGRPPG